MDTLLDPSPSITLATVQLVEESLRSGEVCLTVRTSSMSPALQAGDRVLIRRASADELHIGDIVVLNSAGTLVTHRLIAQNLLNGQPRFLTKGDNSPDADSPCGPSALVGLVASVRRGNRQMNFDSSRAETVNRALAMLSYGHWKAMRGGHTTARTIASKGLHAGLKALVALFAAVLILLFVAGSPDASAAVRVSAFIAKAQGNQIKVTWTTGSEINNVGFNLLRSTSQNGTYTKVNAAIIPSQCLGCVNGSNYAYTDSSVSPGQTYYYRLQSVETSGQTQNFGPVFAMIGGATATAIPAASKTLIPATRTPIPATKTLIPAAAATPVPSATGTPTSVLGFPPGIMLPSRTSPTQPVAPGIPTATRTLTQAKSTAAATPKTRIAYAVTQPSPAPTVGPDTHRSDPPATEGPILVTRNEPINQEDEPADDVPVEQPVAPEGGHDGVALFAVYGLAGLLGCGSFLSGLLAILVFMRGSRRY